jgi:hypothetical protein
MKSILACEQNGASIERFRYPKGETPQLFL